MATANKYDRQLRLWGASGQKALSEARVLLLTAGAVGTEALKNLVLPGVGHVTIADAALVTPRDVASNFFVAPEHVGTPRATVRGWRRHGAARRGARQAARSARRALTPPPRRPRSPSSSS